MLALLGIVLATWAFIELAGAVLAGYTEAFDAWMIIAVRQPGRLERPIGPEWLQEAGRDITALGGLTTLTFFVFAVSGYLWIDRKHRMVVFLLAATGGGMIVSSLLKGVFNRPRPTLVPHLSRVFTTSFPSGHSLMSAVVYLTLGALLASVVGKRKHRVYIIFLAVLLTILVGGSRVYLGVHYPTDVLAGWTAGLIWALLCWVIAHWLQKHGQVESTPDVQIGSNNSA